MELWHRAMSGTRARSGLRARSRAHSDVRAGLWALAGEVESTGWCSFELKAMKKLKMCRGWKCCVPLVIVGVSIRTVFLVMMLL